MPKREAFRKRVVKEKKEFEEEVVQVDRVTRVVKGGRRMSFRAAVVIGNRKGKVGFGIGKANEATAAIQKGVSQAKKRIIEIPIVNDTIPHEVKSKYKATKLIMIPASPGTGIKAGSSARKILELGGIKNILSKKLGSSNRINLARATIKGLLMLEKPSNLPTGRQALNPQPSTLNPEP